MTTADVVVIGAGPAGLSAAATAAEADARVIVLDENGAPGGRLLGQLYQEPGAGWWIGQAEAHRLAKRATAAGAELKTGREVWAFDPGFNVLLDGGEAITAPYVVLATGAAERPLPVPGWTLPGAMAMGAAQTLTNYYRVSPGERVAVVGVDPLSLTVAHEMTMAGIDVVGVYLPPADRFSGARASGVHTLAELSRMARLAPNAGLRAGATLAGVPILRKAAARLYPKRGVQVLGAPLKLRQCVTAIEGDEQVRSVRVQDVDPHGNARGAGRSIQVDAVCLSGGLYPLQELTQGCAMARIDGLGGRIPLTSPELETSVSDLFVAGNVTGVEGAKVAMAQGALVGTVIASRLHGQHGHDDFSRAAEAVAQARRSAPISFAPDAEGGRRMAAELWARYTAGEQLAHQEAS